MITDAFLEILLALVEGIWALLPPWTLTLPAGFAGLVAALSYWDAVAPMSELMAITTMSGAIGVAIIAFKWLLKVVDWIVGIFP